MKQENRFTHYGSPQVWKNIEERRKKNEERKKHSIGTKIINFLVDCEYDKIKQDKEKNEK